MTRIFPIAAFAALAACSGPADDTLAPATNVGEDPAAEASPVVPVGPARGPGELATPPRPLIGEIIAVAEWRKAANRSSCTPLALRSDGADGEPRRANFAGGWAVAFDQPAQRSAYGFAGTGLLPADRADYAVKVDALARQWPLIRRWNDGENLPAGTAVGYGLEGARPYLEGEQAVGQQSLAYLRVPGQACLYNVWTKLGRDHLELLLGQLILIEPQTRAL